MDSGEKNMVLTKAFYLIEKAFASRRINLSIHFKGFQESKDPHTHGWGDLLLFDFELYVENRSLLMSNTFTVPSVTYQTSEHLAWLLAQRIRGIAAYGLAERESFAAARAFQTATAGLVEELMEAASSIEK